MSYRVWIDHCLKLATQNESEAMKLVQLARNRKQWVRLEVHKAAGDFTVHDYQ